MNAVDLKTKAKQHLEGNWIIVIVAAIIVDIVGSGGSFTWLDSRLGSLGIITILLLPIFVGYARLHSNLAFEREANIEDLLTSFTGKEYARALIGIFLQMLFLIGWMLLFFFPVLIKMFSYAMTPYILQDPEYDHLSGNDAITKSREIMNGHKIEYFLIMFSFIGWILLSCLTFGILFFYTIPYMQQTTAEYYLELKKDII